MIDEMFSQWEPLTEPTEDVIKRNQDRVSRDKKLREKFHHDDHDSFIKRLNPTQIQYGLVVGAWRQGQSRIADLTDRLHGKMRSPEKKHSTEAESSCSEIAVGYFMGVTWDAVINKFKLGGDVGRWTQVRHSFRLTSGLHFRPHDEKSKNKPYVSVSGCMGTYLIHGWEWGFKAMQRPQSYADTNRPAWVVPYSELRHMDTHPGEPDHEIGVVVTDQKLMEIMGWSEEDFEQVKDE